MDKVKALKYENNTDGSFTDEYPTEVNPSEDYLSTKGISFENRDEVVIDSENMELCFTDQNGKVNLSKLVNVNHNGFIIAMSVALG